MQIIALHGSLVSLKKRVDDMYPSILQAIAEHHRQQKAALHVLEQPEKASPACPTERVLLQTTLRATDSERSGPSIADSRVEDAPAEPTPAAAATSYEDASSKQAQEPTAPPQVGGLISRHGAGIVLMMLQDTNIHTDNDSLLQEMPDASAAAQAAAVAMKQREEQEKREAAMEQQRAGVERQNAASLARLTAMQRQWQGQVCGCWIPGNTSFPSSILQYLFQRSISF